MIVSETQTKSIELEHVGPIQHLSIPIPEGGGVIILRGLNGCGKSHALNAVEALYSSAARKDLRNSDGMPSGKVEGLGVTVRLGRSNTVKGELVCESLDGRVDPSDLVDPGLKDPLAADAKRLATLIRLAGVKISSDQWQQLIGDVGEEIDLKAFVDADPVATADRLRRRIHDLALTRERLATSKAGESAAIEKTVADVDVDQEHDAKRLAEQLDRATSQLAAAKQQHESFLESVESFDAAKQMLDEVREEMINADEANEERTKCDNGYTDANVYAGDCRKLLKEAEDALAARQRILTEAEHRQQMALSKLRGAEAMVAESNKQQEQIKRLEEIIGRGVKVDVTDEWIAELTQAKSTAFAAVQQGQVISRAIDSKAKAESIRAESEALSKAATKLRELARSTDTVLEQGLIDAGFDTIKVHDGRLCVESERGLEPVSELSHGERWRMALDLAARGLPKGSVLPVCQEAFESLDPANREFVNKLARERGLVIISAEATDGELRAEIL